ncbi:MAG TPA: hypothetical protein VKM54_13800 [Myxococcota bacterium]|nr:hypothetical protein [Myxococcota bacterium]
MGLHELRRSAATRALGNGANVDTVRRLLGHAGLKEILKYLGPDADALRRAVDSL